MTAVEHDAHTGEHAHPSDLTYLKVAVFLAFVTGAEIATSYADVDEWVQIGALMAMMVVKFATVAMFFMHLRFDSKLFRYFFITGLTFATICYCIILSTFHFWTGG